LATGIFPPEIASWLALVLIFGLALGLLFLNRKWIVRVADEMGLFAWFIGIYAHIFYYTSTSYVHVRSWYWIGEMLFTVVLLAVLLECIRPLLNKGYTIQTTVWTGLLVLLCAGSLGLFVNMVMHEFPYQVTGQPGFYADLQVIETHTEPGSLIGMTGSGAIGYFLMERTVVNLDGLINSPEYFHMLRSGQGNLFLDQMGVDYVYGNPVMLTETDPYLEMFAGHLEPVVKFGSNQLYRYLNR